MRILANQPGVVAPDAAYPKGSIADAATVVSEGVNGDIIQFFQRLIIEAGITENDLPDNVSNGYQLIEAMNAKINGLLKAVPTKYALSPLGNWQPLSGDEPGYYKTTDGHIRLVGTFELTSDNAFETDVTELPAEARPVRQQTALAYMYQTGGKKIVKVNIMTDGKIVLSSVESDFIDNVFTYVTLDGVMFHPNI